MWTYAISPVATQSGDELLRHKTTWRENYEAALARAVRDFKCDEVLFVNERGALTEGSRTNIFLQKNGRLLTPPLSEGVLAGCLRQEMVAEGRCQEAMIFPDDLVSADVLFLGNSLRGLIAAVPALQARAE